MMLTVTFPSRAVVKVAAVSPGGIIWTQTENPSSGNDLADSVAVDSSGIYVVDTDNSPGNWEWRIEKRSLTDGSLIAGFGTGGVVTENPSNYDDEAIAVAVDGSGMYVVGYDRLLPNHDSEWRIEKRSLTTGSLIAAFGSGGIITENLGGGWDMAFGVAVDGSGFYVVGVQSPGGDAGWRIEKRDLSTGSLIGAFGSGGIIYDNPSSGEDVTNAVAVDGSGLYIAGYDSSPGNTEWRIEKRSLTTGSLMGAFGSSGIIQENPSSGYDWAYSVAVDGSGLYLAGNDNSPSNSEWRIEKRSLTTGSLIVAFGSGGVVRENVSSGDDGASGVAVDDSGVYVVGYDSSPGVGDWEWRIEKRNLTDGSVIRTLTENPSSGDDEAAAVAVAHGSVYVVGGDESPGPGDGEWRIEAIAGAVEVQLYVGWNLISLPLVPNDPSAQNMLKGMGARNSLIAVWAYVGTPRAWKYLIPGKSSTLTTLNDGYGYWFCMSKADILLVDGTLIPPAGMPPSYALMAGWNLVGFKSQPNADETKSVGTYLSSISGSYDLNSVWIYENSSGAWTRAGSGYVLQPGQAMWVLMTAPAILRP